MGPSKTTATPDYVKHLLWLGVGIGIFYWCAEAAMHVYVFDEGTVVSQVLTRDVHEIWKRLSVFVLILSFCIYAKLRITESRFKDQELKEMERKYWTLFEKGLIPIFLVDTRGHFIDFNTPAVDFFECAPSELKGRSIWDSSIAKNDDLPTGNIFPWISKGIVEIDYLLNGGIKTLLVNLVPYEGSENKIIYGFGQDITRRKSMERKIQHAHTELDQIFQTASVGMRLIDQNFIVLKANETFSALSGIGVEKLIGEKCYNEFKGEMCHTDNCSLVRVLNGEKDIECEVVRKRSDGSEIACLLTVRPFYDPSGNLKGIVESFKNIDELKRIQEDLRNEHDKLHRILFNRFEGVSIVDSNFTIEYFNEALMEAYGNCRDQKCYSVFRENDSPCEECSMHKAFITEDVQRKEFNASTGRIYEQTYTPFKETGGQKKVVISIRDITEAKTAKAFAHRAEQLAALGELAAGVAHEINNPINGIINYSQILKNRNSQNDGVRDIASRILKESNRVALIVERLLSFSSRETQSKIPVDMSEILEDAISLISAQMRKEVIVIERNIPSNLPKIYAAPQEIQQVFINILSNARYALNRKYPNPDNNKIIRINARCFNNNKARYIQVSFFDFGIGIPSHLLNKVISPFFSTKPRGSGTGLGLSISHGIISDHGGKMNIKSRENSFTCVSIDLPTVSGKL